MSGSFVPLSEEIGQALDRALGIEPAHIEEKGFGFKGGGNRKAFFAKLWALKNVARFRAPSVSTVAGGTQIRKKVAKKTGYKAAAQGQRKPVQAQRKAMKKTGYYSAPARIARHGSPKIYGVG